jgi:hypothetical protein
MKCAFYNPAICRDGKADSFCWHCGRLFCSHCIATHNCSWRTKPRRIREILIGWLAK